MTVWQTTTGRRTTRAPRGPAQPAWTTPRAQTTACHWGGDSHEDGDGESSEYEQARNCLLDLAQARIAEKSVQFRTVEGQHPADVDPLIRGVLASPSEIGRCVAREGPRGVARASEGKHQADLSRRSNGTKTRSPSEAASLDSLIAPGAPITPARGAPASIGTADPGTPPWATRTWTTAGDLFDR